MLRNSGIGIRLSARDSGAGHQPIRETADTLAAMREAKRRGARTLAVVNVVGSSIANDADDVIYTWAGPEIAVATTKAYSTQTRGYGFDCDLPGRKAWTAVGRSVSALC